MKDELFEESLKELNAVLSHSDDEFVLPSSGYPLLRACELLSQATGLNFKSAGSESDTIEDICEASGIRYRKVFLTKNWWREGHGHLLGFYKETHQPVVLIYHEQTYEMIDPMSGDRLPLNEISYQKLSHIAYTFYQSLPEMEGALSKILKFCLGRNAPEYAALILTSLLATVIGFFFPLANKVLFDYVIPNFNITLYLQVLIGLIVAALSTTFFLFSRSLIILRLDGVIQNRLQIALWDRLLRLPLKFFMSMTSGDLIQRTLVIETIRRKLNENTLRIIFNSVFGLAYLVMMFIFSWQLALLGIFIGLISTAILITLFFIKLGYDRKILASNATINTFLIQIVNAIAKLRLAVSEKRIFAYWAKEFSVNQRLRLKSQAMQVGMNTSNVILGTLSYILLFAVMILILNNNAENPQMPNLTPVVTIGTFLAFTASYFSFTQAIFDLAATLTSLVELIPYWERIKPIFNTPIETSANKIDPGKLQGHIKIDNLSFRYNRTSPFLFENISLEVKPGECIGITGPSGSGKSTLCRLLVGFEAPERGSILYDDKDIMGIDPGKLRKQMGIMLQSSALFAGTIKDNITGGELFSEDQIRNAMQLATFDEDLANLPMGLATVLPSGGSVLSGGQKQRLMLARAFIRNPKILILDEATSSLDNVIQDRIMKNMEKIEATKILVAHRLSSLKHTNRIYAFENGKLIKI